MTTIVYHETTLKLIKNYGPCEWNIKNSKKE